MPLDRTLRLIATLVLIVLYNHLDAGSASAQRYEYAIFELPVLNPLEPHSGTRAINNSGAIAGASSIDAISLHATFWDATLTISDLGVIDGLYSASRDINNRGVIVGKSNFLEDQTIYEHHAFLWQDGVMTDLGTLGGERSEAQAINDLGQVVGDAQDANERVHAFIWEDGVMQALPGLDPTDYGNAYDINGSGQIVGNVEVDRAQTAALWEDGEVVELPPLFRRPSVALAINEAGQIVGQSDANYEDSHACAWIDGQVHDLHNASLGQHSSAWGINDHGQVVGWVGPPPLAQKGFLWERDTGMRLLDDLVPPLLRKKWTLRMSFDINNAGQIIADGWEEGSVFVSLPFLITPVNPSFSLSQAQPGLAGEVNTITASGLEPGTRVHFLWSRHGGGTMIPGCSIQTNALQIDRPKVAGSAIADAEGNATLEGRVPPIVSGRWLLFQAVVPNECAISNLVVQQFE